MRATDEVHVQPLGPPRKMIERGLRTSFAVQERAKLHDKRCALTS